MTRYVIAVHGCDDSTRVERELSDEEAKLLSEVAVQITETSEYGCQPVMEVSEASESGNAQ